MEIHGTISGKFKVPRNSVDLVRMENVPCNAMELSIWTKFHGIPWNTSLFCWSFMEYHGTTSVVPKVPWKSGVSYMELLGKISFNGLWKEMLNDILTCNQWCWKWMWHYVNSGRLYGLSGARRSSCRVYQPVRDTPRNIGSVTSVWLTHWSLQCRNKPVNMSKTQSCWFQKDFILSFCIFVCYLFFRPVTWQFGTKRICTTRITSFGRGLGKDEKTYRGSLGICVPFFY